MTTVAVLPVKRFDEAKQRLGETMRSGTRRALAEAMLTDVLTALRRARLPIPKLGPIASGGQRTSAFVPVP